MQTNLNTNYVATSKQNPAFGAIKLNGNAPDVLKNVLKPEELAEFKEIVANAAKNTDADAIFWGKGSKKLTGRAAAHDIDLGLKDYSQRLFEGTLAFIKRVCKNADILGEKAREKRNLEQNIDEILKDIK